MSDFHGINMQGPLHVEEVPNLPVWTPEDNRRVLKVLSDNGFYGGTTTGWIRLSVPESLLANQGGIQSYSGISVILTNGFIKLGKTTEAALESVTDGIFTYKTPTNAQQANRFFLHYTRNIAEGEDVPVLHMGGNIFPLVGRLNSNIWSLPANLPEAPIAGTRQDLVFLEIFQRPVGSKGVTGYYGWGNEDYFNEVLGTGLLTSSSDNRVAHTFGASVTGVTYQWTWRIRTVAGTINNNWLDVDDPAMCVATSNVLAQGNSDTPVSGVNFQYVPSLGIFKAGDGVVNYDDGLQTADGYTYAIPIAAVHRRSQEVFSYSKPNGTALVSGVGNGSIAKGEVANGRPDKFYYDHVNKRDVLDIRYISSNMTPEDFLARNLDRFLRGKLISRWVSDIYSRNTNTYKNNVMCAGTVFTADGFGPTSDAVFGNGNEIGYWHNASGGSLYPDGLRRYWGEAAGSRKITAWCMQGDDTSEYPAYFLTYNPVQRVVALNTTALSGNVLLSTTAPICYWYNKTTGVIHNVVFNTNWTGLGTSSATAVIDINDHNAHSGYMFLIVTELDYPEGSGAGLRYNPVTIYEVSDSTTKYLPIDASAVNGFTRTGILSNSTVDEIYLDAGASALNTAYIGEYLHIITSGSSAAGEYRKIMAYNGTTKKITVDKPFTASPATGNHYSISPLEPGKKYVHFDKATKSIQNFYIRQRLIVASSTALSDNVIYYVSAGTLLNSALVNAIPAGYQYIDVIQAVSPSRDSTLRVFYDYVPYLDQYTKLASNKVVTISNVGKLLASTYGLLSTSSTPLTPVSELVPIADGVKNIGKDQPPVTNIFNMNDMGHNGYYISPGSTINGAGSIDGTPMTVGIEIEDPYGLVIAFMLVQDGSEYKILVGTRRKGTAPLSFGNNLYTMYPYLRLRNKM